jgi:ribosomal protein S18 acetylase RimI-like enzyme
MSVPTSPVPQGGVRVRPGTTADARAVARLHVSTITEGFLPTLGERFLRLLYRRIARSPHGVLIVADDGARPAGFVAATTDVAALYRSFLVRDGLAAALVAAPRLARSWRRALETLRYPGTAAGLPAAEILAVAVSASHRSRGLGRCLVATAVEELRARGVPAAKVVAASHNRPALALYRGCGFSRATSIEIHPGVTSEVLTWP